MLIFKKTKTYQNRVLQGKKHKTNIWLNLNFFVIFRALHSIAPSAWTSSVSPAALMGGGSHWRRALKNDFGLSRRQERFCRESPELLPLLSKAAQTALATCQEAFADQRWNCSSLMQAPELSPDLTSGIKRFLF
jgi:wnt family